REIASSPVSGANCWLRRPRAKMQREFHTLIFYGNLGSEDAKLLRGLAFDTNPDFSKEFCWLYGQKQFAKNLGHLIGEVHGRNQVVRMVSSSMHWKELLCSTTCSCSISGARKRWSCLLPSTRHTKKRSVNVQSGS